MDTLKAAVQPDKWVSDILRHTSISYQIERNEDIGKVVTRNGTSDEMITLHYRDVVENPNDVTFFWGLTPKAVEGIPLSCELPARHSVSWSTDAELQQPMWESLYLSWLRTEAHQTRPLASAVCSCDTSAQEWPLAAAALALSLEDGPFLIHLLSSLLVC